MTEQIHQTFDEPQNPPIMGAELLPPDTQYLLSQKLSLAGQSEILDGGWDLVLLREDDDGVKAMVWKPIENSERVHTKLVPIADLLHANPQKVEEQEVEIPKEYDDTIPRADINDTLPRVELGTVAEPVIEIGFTALAQSVSVEKAGDEAQQAVVEVSTVAQAAEPAPNADGPVGIELEPTAEQVHERPKQAADAVVEEAADLQGGPPLEVAPVNTLSAAEQESGLKELYGPDYDLSGLELTEAGHVIPSMDRLLRSPQEFNMWLHTDRVPVELKKQMHNLGEAWTALQHDLNRKQFMDGVFVPTFTDVVESARQAVGVVQNVGNGMFEIANTLKAMQKAAQAGSMAGIQQAARKGNFDYPAVQRMRSSRIKFEEVVDNAEDRRKIDELEEGVTTGRRRVNTDLRSENYPFDLVYDKFDDMKNKIQSAGSLMAAASLLTSQRPQDVRPWSEMEGEVAQLKLNYDTANRSLSDGKINKSIHLVEQDIEMLVDMLRRNRLETTVIDRAVRNLDRDVLPGVKYSQTARAKMRLKK